VAAEVGWTIIKYTASGFSDSTPAQVPAPRSGNVREVAQPIWL